RGTRFALSGPCDVRCRLPLRGGFRSIARPRENRGKKAVPVRFDSVIARSLIRPAVPLAGAVLLSAAVDASACSGRAHIEIKDSGVYMIDYAALIAAQPALADCRADRSEERRVG